MIRSALPLAVLAALGLSACGTDPNNIATPAPSASASQVQPAPYRAGSGVVQSVTVAPSASGGGSASSPVMTTRSEPVTSAGTTATPVARAGQMQRLAIRMDDGRIQYVDMAGPDIPAVGTRVQLTPDHQILRQ